MGYGWDIYGISKEYPKTGDGQATVPRFEKFEKFEGFEGLKGPDISGSALRFELKKGRGILK